MIKYSANVSYAVEIDAPDTNTAYEALELIDDLDLYHLPFDVINTDLKAYHINATVTSIDGRILYVEEV